MRRKLERWSDVALGGLGDAGVPAVAAMLSSKVRGPTRGMEEIDGPETIRRRVIFLDIDGVLQPPSRQTRFKHDLEELRRSLAERFDDETYLSMDKYDLGAVYHDWDSGFGGWGAVTRHR